MKPHRRALTKQEISALLCCFESFFTMHALVSVGTTQELEGEKICNPSVINIQKPLRRRVATVSRDSTFVCVVGHLASVRKGLCRGGGAEGGEVCKTDEVYLSGRGRGHKATAVHGCLSLQGSTPLLSW